MSLLRDDYRSWIYNLNRGMKNEFNFAFCRDFAYLIEMKLTDTHMLSSLNFQEILLLILRVSPRARETH